MSTKLGASKRKMPSERAIRIHWSERLWQVKGFDSVVEFMENGTCFACGWNDGAAERAHIHARCNGGIDTAENLHMLCRICHKDSEGLEGERYWEWLMQRNALDRSISAAIRRGFNPSAMFSLS